MSTSIVEWAGIDAGDKIGAHGAADAIGIDFGPLGVHLDRYHRLAGPLAINPGPLVTVMTVVRASSLDRDAAQRGGHHG